MRHHQRDGIVVPRVAIHDHADHVGTIAELSAVAVVQHAPLQPSVAKGYGEIAYHRRSPNTTVPINPL